MNPTPLETVKSYYGKILSGKKDLKTSACCLAETMPEHIRRVVAEIHPEVQDRFYGCGSPIPFELEGRTVLDLGSGSGRDCFVLAKLVGERGQVIGVDMTEEQLEVANRHLAYHMSRFGFTSPNTRFVKGYIEDLESAGIATASVDVVISNCVINLSPAKDRVFSEIHRVLKPGGEFYFSDVFAGRRVPQALASDPVLLGECLGGALYIEDFRRAMARAGFPEYRVVQNARLEVTDAELHRRAGMIDFYSMTIRAFRLELEDRAEDYGQVAYYDGGIPEAPHEFRLDALHSFATGTPALVSGNTAEILRGSRFSRYFRVLGDRSRHLGPLECAMSPGAYLTEETAGSGGCG